MTDFSPGIIIFFTGMGVSIFGALIGGSSLITIPALILLGLPPHTAIGTDRLGVSGLALSSWYKFHQKKLVDHTVGFSMTLPALVGSFLGANLVLQINEAVLKLTIASLTALMVIFMILRPDAGIFKTHKRFQKKEYLVGALLTFIVGVYAGFYGAMAGTFLFYILILWFGQTFLESTGTLKVPAFFMNATAAFVFAINGAVDYFMGFSLFAGFFIGSYIVAHYSDRIGNVWIRRLFFVVILIMVIRLII